MILVFHWQFNTLMFLALQHSTYAAIHDLVARAMFLEAAVLLLFLSENLQWATKVLRHFVIFEYLRQISFLISTILPPPPFSMLNFLSLEFASFLYNIERGEGG